ncbi:MAG: insulinase family protein [Alphaproteobacteria bacterium]|nr:insulinase family protein [Alphaproteobacteria bacterium]
MTAFLNRVSKTAACALLLAAIASGAARADAPRVSQFVLQNGLQVVVVPDHRAPVVTQLLCFKVGGVDDPPGVSGLANFFEHMMFRGTKSLPDDGYAQTIARNGGEDGAGTTHDYTFFYDKVAKDRLRVVMHLEADRMANLDLSDAAVATERDVMLADRRARIDNNPEALTREQAEAALYFSHPYGRPVSGWSDEIRHIGRMEADNFYRRHYAPNNAILVVVGDVTVDDVRSDAEAEYGPLSPRELVARADYAQPPRLGTTHLAIDSKTAKVPLLLRLYRVQSYAEAAPGRAEALEVLARLLGGGQSSVLYRKLVVERGLATSVGARYDGYTRDAGEFSITARPRPGVPLETLERAIDEIVGQYEHRLPSKAELSLAKSQLVTGATFRRDSQLDLASAYGRALAIGLTVFDVQQWPSRIQAVTGDDVRKAAAASFVEKEAVTAYLTPARR